MLSFVYFQLNPARLPRWVPTEGLVTNLAQRLTKHARLNWQSLPLTEVPSPPFLIFFINSLCNMKCEHCFYWQQLNQKTDLTFEEIVALSEELGPI